MAGEIQFTVDARELTAAMRQYRLATQKTNAEIVNRAARNIALRAVQFTPKAAIKTIDRGLNKVVQYTDWRGYHHPVPIKYLLAAKWLKKRFEGKGKGKLFEMSARRGSKRGRQWQKRVGLAAKRIISSRHKGVAYLKSGWLKAASQIPGDAPIRGKMFRGPVGWGERAAAKAVAIIANNVPGIVKIGTTPLVRAINFVAKDMATYSAKKLQETANRFNAQ